MIELPPVVRETSDGLVVEDQAGHEIVLRTRNGSTGCRTYHDPCPIAAARGRKRIRCRYGRRAVQRRDREVLWRRRDVLDSVWTACKHCTSSDPDRIGSEGDQGGPQLASKLETDDETRSSVEAALQSATGTEGGDA